MEYNYTIDLNTATNEEVIMDLDLNLRNYEKMQKDVERANSIVVQKTNQYISALQKIFKKVMSEK